MDDLAIAEQLDALADEISATRPDECLACYLTRMLPRVGCDGTLVLSRRWHRERGRRTPVQVIESNGGFCDCEVIFNVFGNSFRTARHERLQCDASYASWFEGDLPDVREVPEVPDDRDDKGDTLR